MILVELKCKKCKKKHNNTRWIWSGKMEIKSVKNNQTSSIFWPPRSSLSSISYTFAVQDRGSLKLQKIELHFLALWWNNTIFFRTIAFLKSAIASHLKSRVLFCTLERTILAGKAALNSIAKIGVSYPTLIFKIWLWIIDKNFFLNITQFWIYTGYFLHWRETSEKKTFTWIINS